MKNMIVALALLIPAAAYGSQVCATESVQALLGSTCSIGQITFNFYDAVSTAAGQAPISLSAVTFTPGGSPDDPSFTLSAAFSSSAPIQSSESFELDYVASVNQSGPYSSIVSQLESSYSPSDIGSQFSYQDGVGSGFVEYANCLGAPNHCYPFANSFNDVTIDGSQLILSGSSPSPSFLDINAGETFDGNSAIYLWTSEAITAAYLDSGTSSFTVTTVTPEPSSLLLIAAGLAALAISRIFRGGLITG